MEERRNLGISDPGSSDLEFGDESANDTTSNQTLGMRFNNITIPQGAIITAAYLQFTYDEAKSADPCIQFIKAENALNPITFSASTNELKNRPKILDSVLWTVPSWAGGVTGTRGPAQKSPDIKQLVQVLVDQAGWTSGKSMAFYMTGTGTRAAESFEGATGHGNLNYAPELIVEYLGVPNPVAPIGVFPVAKGSTWAYWADSVAPASNWTSQTFNDSTWVFGPAQLGYGDGDEATVLPFGGNSANKWPSYYFRHKFIYQFSSANPLDSIIFNLLRDDGAVVYLNGNEIFRSNMPTGPISYGSLAASTVGGSAENTYFRFGFPASLLINGLNVLAVSVHQDAVSSSDISFDLEVLGKKPPRPTSGFPMAKNSLWSYWDKGSVDSSWNAVGFDDSSWEYGPGY